MTSWRVDVWNLPHESPHEKVIASVPAVSVSWRDSMDMTGHGVVELPADYGLLNTICNPGTLTSSLLRVYVNQQLAFSFFADVRSDPYDDPSGDRLVRISGDGVISCLDWGKVYPWDWPDAPTVNADWIFGSEESAGSFAAGDMEDLGLNQLSNGGFESGTFSPWLRTGTNGDPARKPSSVLVTAEDPVEGSWCVRVNPLEARSGIWQKDVRATVGQVYQVTARVKATNDRYLLRVGSSNVVLAANNLGGGAPNLFMDNVDNVCAELDNAPEGEGDGDGTWQTINLGVEILDYIDEADDDENVDALLNIRVTYAGTANGGVYFVDDVQVIATDDGFAPWLPRGDATLSVNTTTPHSGAQCLQVLASGDTAGGAKAGVKQLVTGLSPGRRYTFSAWVRNQEAGTVDVRLQLRDQFGGVRASESFTLAPTTWEFCSVDAIIPETSVICQIVLDTGVAYPKTFRVDDALLAPGGPPATPGFIVKRLIDAINDRGTLAWLAHDTFDGQTDSDNVDWDERLSITIQRGASLLDVVKAFRDQGIETRVGWDAIESEWQIVMYNDGGLGTDRSGDAFPALLYGGDAIIDSERHRGTPPGNVVLSEGDEGIVIEVENTSFTAAYDRRELYTGDQELKSTSTVTRRANKALAQAVKRQFAQRLLVSSEAGAAPLPFINFDLGDTVPVRWISGQNPQQTRVVGWDVRSKDEEIEFDLHLERWRPQSTEAISLAVSTLLSDRKRMLDPASVLATPLDLSTLVATNVEPVSGGQTFIPVLRAATTNPFLGAGVATGTVTVDGQWVDIEFLLELGAGFTAGSGFWRVEVPYAPQCPAGTPIGQVHLQDASGGASTDRRVWALVARDGENLLDMVSNGTVESVPVGPTTPWTWAVGDHLHGQARYRIGDIVAQTAPYLENIDDGSDSTTVTTRDIGLSTGNADKVIILHELQGNSTTITVPTGWTLVGPNPITQNQHAMLYRTGTTETSVTLTTNGASRQLHWWTADVVDGSLADVEVAHSSQSGSATQIFSTTTGALTSWRGIVVCSQFGTMTTPGASPTTWPADTPDDQRFASFTNTLSTNDYRTALASGAFIGTTSVAPDNLVWDESHQRAGLTIAIPWVGT